MTAKTGSARSGGSTFLNWPRATLDEVEPGMIVVVGAPSDFTGSVIGPRFGPEAIRQASCGIDYRWREPGPDGVVDVRDGSLVRFRDDARAVDAGDIAVYAPQLEPTTASISQAAAEIVRRGGFPVLLGGDHYVSYPMVAGVAEARGGRLGYIQLDAHLDLQDDNPNHGRFWHGSNARRVAELPEFATENMVWMGALDIAWIDEWRFARDNGCTIITIDEMKGGKLQAAVERALEIAGRGTDAIYMTLDIDVCDHAHSPGTGFTNFGGLTGAEFIEVLRLLGRYPQIAGVDIVEVTPPRDVTGATAMLAANGLVSLLEPRILDPRRPA